MPLYIFRLTDGARTVNLNGACRALDYVPQKPDGDATIESFSVFARGTTGLNDLATLEQLLLAAHAYHEEGIGAPVYVEAQRTSTSRLLRSRLHGGSKENTEGFSSWQTRERKDNPIIQWTREPYWENAALVTVPLSNSRTPVATLNGIVLQNGFDIPALPGVPADIDNTAYIAPNTIIGTLPAPPRLEFYMLDDGDNVNTIHVSLGVARATTSYDLNHVFEAEQGTGGTPITASPASNGVYKRWTWTGDAAVRLSQWSIDSDFFAIANGGWFRLIGRLQDHVANTWVWWTVEHVGYRIAATQPVFINTAGDEVMEFGSLQLPPYQRGTPLLANLKLALWARKAGGGALPLDYLMTLPTDGWRTFTPIDSGTAQYATVVDDPDTGNAYSYWGPAIGSYGNYIADGKLLLQPGVAQRLNILHTITIGTVRQAPPRRELQLAVRYRPRWSTL